MSAPKPARRRTRLTPLVALVLLVAVAGCGSRRPDAELLAAAQTSGTTGGARPAAGQPLGSGPGAVDNSGTITGTDPGSAGGSGGSATPGAAGPTGTGGAAAGGGGGAGDATVAAGCSQSLSPIVIGAVGTQSGLIGQIVGDGPKAVQAWVAAVNAKGGLQCHPVKYIIRDDGGDPSTHQAQVRELVEEQHVIAFVQMNAPLTGSASLEYLTQRQIPVIGQEGASDWFYSSPMYFPQITSGDSLSEMVVAAAADAGLAQGLTRWGQVTCIEAALCAALYSTGFDLATKYGLTPVYRGQASLVQPDFTSICQSAKQAGAQVFFPGVDSNSIIRLQKNCDSVGFHPLYLTGTSIASPQLAQSPRAEGMLIILSTLPPFRTDNASMAELGQVLGQYAPGLSPTAGAGVGWASAMLLERAAQHVSEPPTSQSLLEGLWSIQGDDLGGITGPLTFTSGQPPPRSICYWTTQIHDGAYVDYGSGGRVCK